MRGHIGSAMTAVLLLGSAASPGSAQQGVLVTAGRVLAGSPEESSWRLTVQRDLFGPIGLDGSFVVLPGARPATGDLYGAGADITLFSANRGLPTLLIGAAAGLGYGGQERFWASGSVGARMSVISLGPFRLMAEGRWRNLTIDGRDGFEVGAVFGWRAASRSRNRPEAVGLWVPRSTFDVLRNSGIPDAKARVINDVITTALDEMGQPYVWGGTGDGEGGFDCSGLIYYAYGRHGISVPRTAESQSRAGIAIRRDPDVLLPGDILTFSERGSGEVVTHVGLYVGEGRFIHSASGGVRLSRLSDDDPEGRTWIRKWTGVRRVIE